MSFIFCKRVRKSRVKVGTIGTLSFFPSYHGCSYISTIWQVLWEIKTKRQNYEYKTCLYVTEIDQGDSQGKRWKC